jgi:hypothetical protein
LLARADVLSLNLPLNVSDIEIQDEMRWWLLT